MPSDDWQRAANIMVRRVLEVHGDARARALLAHNATVVALGDEFGWDGALRYDIAEREVWAIHPTHDIATKNNDTVQKIANRRLKALTAAVSAAPPPGASPAGRRPVVDGYFPPRKRARAAGGPPGSGGSAGHCFRCGRTGHYPASCFASTTAAGRPVASLLPRGAGGGNGDGERTPTGVGGRFLLTAIEMAA